MQGEVLQGELAVAAAEEREEAKQVEQESDHRAEIVAESELTVHPLARRRSFGEGQVSAGPVIVRKNEETLYETARRLEGRKERNARFVLRVLVLALVASRN